MVGENIRRCTERGSPGSYVHSKPREMGFAYSAKNFVPRSYSRTSRVSRRVNEIFERIREISSKRSTPPTRFWTILPHRTRRIKLESSPGISPVRRKFNNSSVECHPLVVSWTPRSSPIPIQEHGNRDI